MSADPVYAAARKRMLVGVSICLAGIFLTIVGAGLILNVESWTLGHLLVMLVCIGFAIVGGKITGQFTARWEGHR